MKKTCQHCGRPFTATRRTHKFCTPACRSAHHRRKQRLADVEYLLATMPEEHAAGLQALEDYAPGTRELIAGIVADHDIDAGRQALQLAHHVAGVVAEEV